jgi:hypothetical protein
MCRERLRPSEIPRVDGIEAALRPLDPAHPLSNLAEVFDESVEHGMLLLRHVLSEGTDFVVLSVNEDDAGHKALAPCADGKGVLEVGWGAARDDGQVCLGDVKALARAAASLGVAASVPHVCQHRHHGTVVLWKENSEFV